MLLSKLKIFVLTPLVLLLALGAAAGAAGSITEGFATSGQVTPGSLVALSQEKLGQVEPANLSNVSRLAGVVVETEQASISLSGAGQAQVATSGTATVFVTTVAGSIKAGDAITASPVSGVGMKANDSSKIIGTAKAGFDSRTVGAKTIELKTKEGKKQIFHIGTISVAVDISQYSPQKAKGALPVTLQEAINRVAGKQVSPLRAIIAIVVVLLAMGVVGLIVYTSVRSSIIAIGRNPMAQIAIYRGMNKVILAAVAVLAISMGLAYLILKV